MTSQVTMLNTAQYHHSYDITGNYDTAQYHHSYDITGNYDTAQYHHSYDITGNYVKHSTIPSQL